MIRFEFLSAVPYFTIITTSPLHVTMHSPALYFSSVSSHSLVWQHLLYNVATFLARQFVASSCPLQRWLQQGCQWDILKTPYWLIKNPDLNRNPQVGGLTQSGESFYYLDKRQNILVNPGPRRGGGGRAMPRGGTFREGGTFGENKE